MPSPLFSTYRQGENRVSASMLAVFERLGIDLVSRILGGALERPELGLVEYQSQPSRGGAGVPDGEMSASFRFLFEVKTVPDAITSDIHLDQIRRHLKRLDGQHGNELLVVLTPDANPPTSLDAIADDRIVWTNFETLTQAIDDVLQDPSEPASEQQRFLLRELTDLFELDGLIGHEDVVVVAARRAYDVWREHAAYVCQADRTIRPVTHWGFYRSKHIEPEFPLVRRHFGRVDISEAAAQTMMADNDPLRHELGVLVRALLAEGLRTEGTQADVYLLQSKDDPALVRRSESIIHDSKGAWTQHQRYTHLEQLLEIDFTSELDI